MLSLGHKTLSVFNKEGPELTGIEKVFVFCKRLV